MTSAPASICLRCGGSGWVKRYSEILGYHELFCKTCEGRGRVPQQGAHNA